MTKLNAEIVFQKGDVFANKKASIFIPNFCPVKWCSSMIGHKALGTHWMILHAIKAGHHLQTSLTQTRCIQAMCLNF
jgi:hypothetical protein